MGLRDRVKKTFKKGSGSSSGSSSPSSGSDPTHYTGRTDIEYYKPHEIPRSKYRGKVDPEHKEMLENFSLTDAFSSTGRRASAALSGIMSPGGTKSQSRRPSFVSHKSHDGRKSVPGTRPTTSHGPHPLSRQGTITESSSATLTRGNSDDHISSTNAGLSKQETVKDNHANVPQVKLERQATVPDQPFTASELEEAMKKASLRHESETTLRNSPAIAAH